MPGRGREGGPQPADSGQKQGGGDLWADAAWSPLRRVTHSGRRGRFQLLSRRSHGDTEGLSGLPRVTQQGGWDLHFSFSGWSPGPRLLGCGGASPLHMEAECEPLCSPAGLVWTRQEGADLLGKQEPVVPGCGLITEMRNRYPAAPASLLMLGQRRGGFRPPWSCDHRDPDGVCPPHPCPGGGLRHQEG